MTTLKHKIGNIQYLVFNNKKNITRWLEDINFVFSRHEQYLTSERSERVRYCSCHSNIKFISSRHRVVLPFTRGKIANMDASKAHK